MPGLLLDKSADGDCAWVRVKAVNAYWPDGNFATKDAWKVCGKGIEKTGQQDRGSMGKNGS